MYNKQTVLSWRRIKYNIKKYFWVLIIAVLLSVISLFVGISNNKKKIDTSTISEVITTFLFHSEENKQSIQGFVGDLATFLQTEQFEEKLNDYLEAKKLDKYSENDTINIKLVEVSNCFRIIVSSNDVERAKTVSDFVCNFFEEKTEYYYTGIQYKLIEQKENENVKKEKNISIIQLKDLLIAILILGAGIVILYFLMIFDRRIMSEEEGCLFFNTVKCLSVENLDDLCTKLKVDNLEKKKILVLPEKLEDAIREKLKGIRGINIISLDDVTENELCGMQQWIILYGGMIIEKEYDNLNAANLLNKQEIEGIIFIRDL